MKQFVYKKTIIGRINICDFNTDCIIVHYSNIVPIDII